MTRLEALVKVIGRLAWPLTIVMLVVVFHHDLTTLLRSVTKLEFPGGSITVRIDEIETGLPNPEPLHFQAFSPAELADTSLIRSEGDPRTALARIWFALEQELFRPSEIGLSPPIEASKTTSRRISDLVEARILDSTTAHHIREFSALANEVTLATRGYSIDELNRAIDVGAQLVAEVRRQIVGAELQHHLQSNLLWLHAQQPEVFPGGMRSTVAASAPDFEYDYDLYRQSIETYNLKEAAHASQDNYDVVEFKPLTLNEFVQVLEFREREIMRVLREMRKPAEQQLQENLEWRWPQAWGDVGWTGPVLRKRASTDLDLEKLRRALASYERRLTQ